MLGFQQSQNVTMLMQRKQVSQIQFSIDVWQSKHEPHLMHTMLFLLLQIKQVRYSSFISDVYMCGVGMKSCSSDAITLKYVLFLNSVFPYRLFIGSSPYMLHSFDDKYSQRYCQQYTVLLQLREAQLALAVDLLISTLWVARYKTEVVVEEKRRNN